ncbi:hypothetical protein LIER_40737 [Lithospermum erythrorhizon]|uniref:HVA22-like protein n=1 Tax=Lithospermum erythrorhizon TaxID=34254 RepID=A0AAV3QYX1_LITER
MSQTSDEFVGSLLRESPEVTNVVAGSGVNSPNVEDSQGPLDVVPLRSLMGPPADVPVAQGPRVNPPETSNGKGSKDPQAWIYGLRLPVVGFVEEVLVTLYRAPGQLMTFAWLLLKVFQVACLVVGVSPNLALFCTIYNVIHKGPLYYFQVVFPQYNFLYTKKVDKVEFNRFFRLWFLAKGGFGDDVQAH